MIISPEEFKPKLNYSEEELEELSSKLFKEYKDKPAITLPFVKYEDKEPSSDFWLEPICPICGTEMPNTDQCQICGQHFILDEDVEYWNTPETGTMDCFCCGGTNTVTYSVSKCNGHKHGSCSLCGMTFHE